MTTYTRTVPAGDFASFRRNVLRHGGNIVRSVFCLNGTNPAGGYRVTYTAGVQL